MTTRLSTFFPLLLLLLACVSLIGMARNVFHGMDRLIQNVMMNDGAPPTTTTTTTNLRNTTGGGQCALLFFGLPRSFRTVVFPSIVRNILGPNLIRYRCDIFVHFFWLDHEPPGRNNAGGKLKTDDVKLLEGAVLSILAMSTSSTNDIMPRIDIINDTKATFQQKRNETVTPYLHHFQPDGNYTYIPIHSGITELSVMNTFSQWHSIESVWKLLEKQNKTYDRVGLFRSDVVFVTPIDLYAKPDKSQLIQIQEAYNGHRHHHHQTRVNDHDVVVLPSFGLHPINDRIFLGPYGAAKIWASERFSRLEHDQERVMSIRGKILHSESFQQAVIYPAIRDAGYTLAFDDHMCFFRARANNLVLSGDCFGVKPRPGEIDDIRNTNRTALVGGIVGHACVERYFNTVHEMLDCNRAAF